MSRTRTLFATGILIAVLPYLGFPHNWKNFLFALLGLGLALFAYTLNRDARKQKKGEETFENFKENVDFKSEDSRDGTI